MPPVRLALLLQSDPVKDTRLLKDNTDWSASYDYTLRMESGTAIVLDQEFEWLFNISVMIILMIISTLTLPFTKIAASCLFSNTDMYGSKF